ncbi:MAG: dephospho-CoA kinase [Coriobacteriales bacterium]|nr:dephospho-CoA kinase [Coriobacteriales bacterium]
MYVVFLAGGIASGKSTVARELERLGALRVDLDELSREATRTGSVTNDKIAQEFGADVLDPITHELRRAELARRAFSSAERTRALESIVHPAIRELLLSRIRPEEGSAAREESAAREGSAVGVGQPSAADHTICVVEIPLLDRVEDLLPLADEIMCVICPRELRRERAIGRGMRGEDFDARVAQQPSDAYLTSRATTVITNDKDANALLAQINDWWVSRRKQQRG